MGFITDFFTPNTYPSNLIICVRCWIRRVLKTVHVYCLTTFPQFVSQILCSTSTDRLAADKQKYVGKKLKHQSVVSLSCFLKCLPWSKLQPSVWLSRYRWITIPRVMGAWSMATTECLLNSSVFWSILQYWLPFLRITLQLGVMRAWAVATTGHS